MGDYVNHTGIIRRVEERTLYVAINKSSSCSSCSSKSTCFSSNQSEMLVEVENDGKVHNIGDIVELRTSVNIGLFAMFFAYCLPLLILIVVLFILIKFFQFEDIEAIVLSLASLVVYYGLLYTLRNRIKQKIKFELK